MNKALLTLALAVNFSAFAQGTIQLSNSNLPGPTPGTTYEAVISDGSGGLGGPLDMRPYTAGLFLEGSTSPLVTTTFFYGTGDDAQYNYVFATEPQVAVPGIAPGQTGRFFVGAWRTDQGSFATAFIRGQSAIFTSRPLGGPNPIPGELPFTTPVTTFQGFPIMPEPTTTSLAALGFGAFLLRRRKQSRQ